MTVKMVGFLVVSHLYEQYSDVIKQNLQIVLDHVKFFSLVFLLKVEFDIQRNLCRYQICDLVNLNRSLLLQLMQLTHLTEKR
jgi:hypothetical protein